MKEGKAAAQIRRGSSKPKARPVPSAAMAAMGATKGIIAAGMASLASKSIFFMF